MDRKATTSAKSNLAPPPRRPPGHPLWKRILAWTVALGGVASILSLSAVVATVWWYGRKADTVDPERLLDYHPPQVTRVLARDGTVIGELVFEERRTVVGYDALPEHLVSAFLAAEDADFFDHDGLDWPGIARAVFANLTQRHVHQGASTITQQVIKNTLLSHARTLERKSQELVLAGRVEAVLSKRQILEIYVNQVYFGEGRYGVEEAARWYFGKSVGEVDLGEAAVLAALPQAPGVVTPYRRPEALERRRDYVLRQMREHGFARAEDIAPYLEIPIVAVDHSPGAGGHTPGAGGHTPGAGGPTTMAIGDADEFVALALAELTRRYGEAALPTLGATVRTSVDLDLQREARAAGRRELAELEARHGYGRHGRPISDRARRRLEARAPTEVAAGERHTVLLEGMFEARSDGREEHLLQARLGAFQVQVKLPPALFELPPVELDRRFPRGGALEVRITAVPGGALPLLAELGPGPELALVLADVRSGELRAVVGGVHFRRGDFDRAREARRQPGSAFKPVVYGAALDSREFTPASTAIGGGQGGIAGEPMRLRDALAHSDNAVALALMAALGPEAVHAFARDLGITAPLGPHLSLALGTSELTPMELLTAYLTLARGGVGMDPRAIIEIDVPPDLRGERPTAIAHPRVHRTFGVDAEVAAVLTSMLASVVEVGTAKSARSLGRPTVGKTGTTDDARDAWFAGYTADHVAVAWVGFDSPRSLGARESGSHVALPIWISAMRHASAGLPIRDFDQPASLVHATVDGRSGGPACRPARHWYTPERCTTEWIFESCAPAHWREVEGFERCVSPQRWVDELFIAGTEPGTRDLPPKPLAAAGAQPIPDTRGEIDAPQLASVGIEGVGLFQTRRPGAAPQLDGDALRAHLGPLEAALERRWRQALGSAQAQRKRERTAWSRSEVALGTSLEFAVQLDANGDLVDSRLRHPSGDPTLDAWAEAAVATAIRDARTRPLAAMLEPESRTAELEIALQVGPTRPPE